MRDGMRNLEKDEVVEQARPERLQSRGDYVDWVLYLPTFLRQSLAEDREVMVAGGKRRVRKYVEVLQCRRCCGYGHGYAVCDGAQCCKRCGGPHEIRDCVGGPRECVVCRRTGATSVGHSAGSRERPVHREEWLKAERRA